MIRFQIAESSRMMWVRVMLDLVRRPPQFAAAPEAMRPPVNVELLVSLKFDAARRRPTLGCPGSDYGPLHVEPCKEA